MKPDLMTQVLSLESREKIHVCGCATYAWECSVYTSRRLQKSRQNNLICKKHFRSHTFDVCDQEEDCHHEDGCHPVEEEFSVD